MDNNVDGVRLLVELEHYTSLLDRLGAEPSIGKPDGTYRGLPNVFFVDSGTGANTNNGRRPDKAVATLAYAVANLPTANNGDVIVVLPGHTETIAAAAGIACATAGVSIVGIGTGAARPTFTWSTTGSTWTITAASVSIKNILCTSTVAAMVKMFSVSAAHATFEAVDYVEDGATDALQFILTTAAADYLKVIGCKWIADTTAPTSVRAWIGLVGADYATITDNFCYLRGTAANSADGFVVGATTLSKAVEIARNTVVITISTGAIGISLLASSTGHVHHNSVASVKTAIAGQVACASAYASENYVNNTVNLSGLLDPVVDS